MRLALAVALSLLAGAAVAQSCATRVNGQELFIVPEAMETPSPGLRERLVMWPSRSWDRAWGEREACDSGVVTTFLAATMRLDQTEGYCLVRDDAMGFLLVPGQRNWRGICRATVCDRVNAAADAANAVTLSIASVVARRPVEDDGDAVVAVAHGTGAMMVTGQAPAVATALGQGAGAVGAALASPAAAGAAAVTVVSLGGAVWLCS